MVKPRSAKGRAKETLERLGNLYPGKARELCALRFETPFQLLAATILSAQTTDIRVNMVTPILFERYPDAPSLAAADPEDVEEIIKSTGFFRNKTKSIIAMATDVTTRFDGEVPVERDDLVSLAGVGRKTANVVRSVAFDAPGLPVDTHVMRLSKRLGLTQNSDAEKIEADLMPMIAPADWGTLSIRLILHGREVCISRKPRCEACALADFCPSVVPTVSAGSRSGR